MNTAEEIERIVREVIRRVTSAQAREMPTAAGQQPGTLTVSEQVITLAAIEGRLHGITQLVVPAKAVVTPSVRDELRHKQVRLVKQDQTLNATQRTLLIANLGKRSITQAIRNLPCEMQIIQPGTLESTVADMTGQLTSESLGVFLTEQPELAVCLANRHANVRAFVGHGIESVRRAKAFQANVLALDSRTSTALNLIRAWVN